MVIYQFSLNGVGVEPLVDSFTMVPQMMAEQIAGNGALLLFLALLGALTVVIATAGGSRAYAEWVTTHVKNARAASILTALLGIIIFVDDYFNCLTVGAVMRPVTDKFRVSHEKLAWIIDSTAAPVCIIAPVSSWAVAVGGYMGEDGFNTFVASIPYNLSLIHIFSLEPDSREAWDEAMGAALAAIGEGRVSKVVLSRRLRLVAEHPFSSKDLLVNLIDGDARGTVLLYRYADVFFCGCTPELLVRKRGDAVASMCLAGTCPTGATSAESDRCV